MKTKLEKSLAALEKEAVKKLQQFVQIESTTGIEQKGQAFIAELMKEAGMEMDIWCPTDDDLKGLKGYDGCGADNLGDRPNVVGIAKGSGQGRSLILNGHVDTVPAGDLSKWIYGPYSGHIEDGELYGRGACDMKAGLLAAVFAYKAVKDAGIKLKGDVQIQSVIGEELGGVGTLACVGRGYQADGAIIMEPTSNVITTGEVGTMLFRIIIDGKPAHGSASYEGVNAIDKFCYVYKEIRNWADEYNQNSDEKKDPRFKNYKVPCDLSFGIVNAGTWCAMLPEFLTAEGRYGFPIKESVASARKLFEKELERISQQDEWLAEHPVRVEWYNVAWEPYDLPASHPLVTTLQEVCAEAGMSTEIGGNPYGTDIKYMNDMNTPAVIFGPGTIKKGHFVNESVPIKEYLQAINILARMIVRWCGAVE
jgi:acetylornithine deacetylase